MKNDISDLVITQEEINYISSIKDYYCNKKIDSFFKTNIERFNTLVNKCCDKLSKEKAAKGLTPYSFYSEVVFNAYKNKFKAECKSKYGCDLPYYLETVFGWISLKCENFQSMSAYLLSYTQISREINLADINKQMKDFGDNVKKKEEELDKKIKETDEKLSESEKQMTERSVTILGIFAAIVLTFNSGLTFSSTVLQNLINSNIYRAIIITIVLGLIIANVLLGLFYYLDHVIEKSEKKRRKIKSIIPMIILNIILAVMLAFTVHAWDISFVENRGYVKNDEPQTTQVEETTVAESTEKLENTGVLEEATIYAEITVISVEREEKVETTTVAEESTTCFIDVTP
ncbi:MAG: hypothetical protein E7547_02935 [Ruminococcaceae bacterium]|nr:hypothetical protein [Oscillospiraceae bacterium]